MNVIGVVPAVEQPLRNLGQVGSGVHPLWRSSANSVEVRSQTDVVHARDFGDVVNVIDE